MGKVTEELNARQMEYAREVYGDVWCSKCKNYLEDGKCKAFDKIPTEIAVGHNKHETPYAGDGGIMFEPKK